MTPSDNSFTISPHNLALLHSTLLHSYPVPLRMVFHFYLYRICWKQGTQLTPSSTVHRAVALRCSRSTPYCRTNSQGQAPTLATPRPGSTETGVGPCPHPAWWGWWRRGWGRGRTGLGSWRRLPRRWGRSWLKPRKRLTRRSDPWSMKTETSKR